MSTNYTVSSDVDTLLRSTDNYNIRSNIGAAGQSAVSGLLASVSSNTNAVHSNYQSILTLNSDMEVMGGYQASNTANIATNTAEIDTLSSSLTSVANQTATNTSNIATNASNIAAKATIASPTFVGDVGFKHQSSGANLVDIKKLSGKAGARVGINMGGADPKCALHVTESSSDGYPNNEAIRCNGGLRISNWLRLGPYTDSERDDIGLDPPAGLMLYNEESYGVQVFIANPSGSGRGSWKTLAMQGPATSIYPIWAEESDIMSVGITEWSFGNGDETPAAHGIPIGFRSKLLKVSVNIEITSGGTTTQDIEVEVYKNGVATGAKGIITSGLSSSDSKKSQVTDVSASNIVFEENDIINFKTLTNGNVSSRSCRVCAWMQNY